MGRLILLLSIFTPIFLSPFVVVKGINAQTNKYSIDAQGYILRNNARFFPVGIYGAVPEETTGQLVNIGFNTVQTYAVNDLAYLDNLKQRNIDIGVLGNFSIESTPLLKNHAQFFGYYIADEPEYQHDLNLPWPEQFRIMRENANELKNLTQNLNSLDPNHLTYLVNNADYAYDVFKDSSDVLMIDPYPYYKNAPSIPSTYLSDRLELAKSKVGKKPIITVLQAHGNIPDTDGSGPCKTYDGWDKYREPTYDEGLNMAYLSLIHEAKGLFWFMWGWPGDHYYLPCSPQRLQNIKAIAQEISRFSHIFLLNTEQAHPLNFWVNPIYKDPNGNNPIHSRVVKESDRYYLIIANEGVNADGEATAVPMLVQVKTKKQVKQACDLRTDYCFPIDVDDNNAFTVGLESLQVALVEIKLCERRNLACDGEINLSNILVWRRLWAQSDSRADANGDGKTNLLDYLALLRGWLE